MHKYDFDDISTRLTPAIQVRIIATGEETKNYHGMAGEGGENALIICRSTRIWVVSWWLFILSLRLGLGVG